MGVYHEYETSYFFSCLPKSVIVGLFGCDAGIDESVQNPDLNGPGLVPGSIGAPCESDNDCSDFNGEPGICFTEIEDGFPGGYCSARGRGLNFCGADNVGPIFGLNFIQEGGRRVEFGATVFSAVTLPTGCYVECNSDSDCRDGYACQDINTGFGTINIGKDICVPLCNDDSQCTEAGFCDNSNHERLCTTEDEICDDGIDNDPGPSVDGIDCNDQDCFDDPACN